jgi:hypothetical protein
MSVFLARKDGQVVHHTDKKAMKALDGIATPEKTVTDAEFEAAGGLARIINGEIFLGKTAAEIAAETATARITEIDAQLEVLDQKSIRPSRAVSQALSKNQTPAEADVAKVDEIEAQIATLRSERQSMVS